jgi:hypothetical protein
MIKGNFSIANTIKCSAVNFSFFLVILALKFSGQSSYAVTQAYIKAHANEAINQMIEYKIPASVILAQAILESGGGNSVLAKRSNNHFGIKCHVEWGGDTIRKSDDTLAECFRRYDNIEDSYTDHSLFLKSRPRYSNLFKLPFTDYKGWCYGLKNSGYATHTCYTEELLQIIENYHLYDLDRNEILTNKTLLVNNNYETRESTLMNYGFTLKELCQNDLLWNDEKYLIIQSIELLIEHPEKIADKIAENK